jgi:hypothetical protein
MNDNINLSPNESYSVIRGSFFRVSGNLKNEIKKFLLSKKYRGNTDNFKILTFFFTIQIRRNVVNRLHNVATKLHFLLRITVKAAKWYHFETE